LLDFSCSYARLLKAVWELFLSYFLIFAPFFIIAICCVNVRAQTTDERSSVEDTVKRLPPKIIEITALRPSDLPAIDPRQAAIKPTDELYRVTGATLTSDALKALSSSLDIREYGSLGSIALPSFRGLPSEYTIVYRDGIRMTNEQLGETDLGQLTLHGISYVELIPASSAVLLGGDAIGSAINLVSKIQDTNAITIGSQQTTYEGSNGFPTQSYYARASLNPLPSLSIVAGGSLDTSTGVFPFFQDSAHPNVLRENNSAVLGSANLSALWTASDNTTVRLLGNYFYADRGAAGGVTTEGIGASSLYARQTDAQTFGAIKADHDEGALASTFSLGWQRQFESYNDPSLGAKDSTWNNLLDASARASYTFTQAVQCYGGIEEEHTTLTGNTNIAPNADSLIGRYRTSAYAAAKVLPIENVDMNGSVRMENISDLGLTEFLPQAAINYSPMHDLYLGGAYSKSFHAPTLNDLYWYQGGNANLKPESGENWQSSISFEPEWSGVTMKLAATGFLTHINDEIVWLPSVGTEYTPINIGEVESKGLEITVDVGVRIDPRTSLKIEESYTWLSALNITPGDPNYGNQIPYSSPTRSLFTAEIERSDLGSLAVLARYRGHEYSDVANTIDGKLQPVTTFDLTLFSREFSIERIGARVLLSVVDLTNQHYEDVINYPLPSRTYNFSIELSYH
jgi:iron complex outermembrane receptor protein